MCPIYTWIRVDTEEDEQPQECEVVRKFDDYEIPPQDDEYPEASRHKWKRIMPSGTTTRKPLGWGKKGSWINLFILGGLQCLAQYRDTLL